MKNDKNPPAGKAADTAAPDLLALAEQSDGFERAMAKEIKAKMAAGLTKEQALICCKEQLRHDAKLAKKAEAEAAKGA